jgi:endonuclease/exonuclease/phosphatase family metal-dependent hydrolase
MAKIHKVRWGFKDNPAHRKFVAERLKGLRAGLRADVHAKTSEHSLRLATWNIMHFGNSGGYDRTVESMLYIAEIIDHFDLIAVQEVNRNLRKLNELVEDYLGDGWDYVVSDTSGKPTGDGPKDQGNDERLAFLFRKEKVQFLKEVGEVVLPQGYGIRAADGTANPAEVQFARTPFAITFRSGWLEFKLVTVHIYYGNSSANSPEMAQRKAEIAKIAEFMRDRQAYEQAQAISIAKEDGWTHPEEGGWKANYLLLGDFNIISRDHETMKQLIDHGFTPATTATTTDLGDKHHYDQIVYKAAHPGFAVGESGAFDMLDYVYRDADAAHYINVAKIARLTQGGRDGAKAEGYFKQYYRRHQLSDHKLLWCEIKTDYADAYLDAVIAEQLP